MKQVLQDRSGLTVVRDVPAPPCPPGSVLVRNAFSAISSGTERARVELSQRSLLAKARERPDLVREVVDRARREGLRSTRRAVQRKLTEETAVGYSSAGRVLEIGEAVRDLAVGDLVACAGGGHANHAEIVSVPRNLCAKVPAGVPLEVAALTTIAAIALHGVRLADVEIGDRVAVIGCGLVGQITCRLLRAAGAETFALDLDPARTEAAAQGGADHGLPVEPATGSRLLAATGGTGVDRVIITAATSTNDPLVLATEIARDRGAIVVVGDVRTEAPRSALYHKELSLRVSRSYGPGRYDGEYEERGLDYPIGYVRWTEQRNMEAFLKLQARGRINVSDLVEEVVPVDEAARAYGRLAGPAASRPTGALLLSYDGEAAVLNGPIAVELPRQASSSRRQPSSQGPIRVGLIGPGAFASNVLVPAFLSAGAQLEVVGGGSGPSAEATKRSLGFARVASSPAAVIADDAVDAVVIANRHGAHATLAIEALGAGKHVFCEKPLALTQAELEAVLEAATNARGILAVGFNRRFSPLLRELRDFLAHSPGPIAASYRVSAGRIDAEHWMHDLHEGGGRILGEGCHFIDSLRFLAGADVDLVYAVGYGARELPVQAHDNVALTLTFSDGSIGSIQYVSDGAPKVPKERLEAFTAQRTGILDDYRELDLHGPSGAKKSRPGGQDKGHRLEVEAFLQGIRTGEAPVTLNEIGNVSLATIASIESLRTSRPVRLES